MLESEIEKKLTHETEKKLGGLCLKFSPVGRQGYPDRIILLPGKKIFFVETKQPGKPLRPLQRKRQRELIALGFPAEKIDTLEGVEKFIAERRKSLK